MAAFSYPVFTGPGGADPVAKFRQLAAQARPTAGDCLYAGHVFRSRVIQRTLAGIDSSGSPFAPYSAGYQKAKAKKLGHANIVNLFGFDPHPHMLNSIAVQAGFAMLQPGDGPPDLTRHSEPVPLFQVGFFDDETAARARIHNEGEGRMPKREFFTPNSQDVDLMGLAIRERMDRRIKSIFG